MKNLMKVLVVLMALGAVIISCKKTEVVQHITQPGIFAAYATIVNGVNIPPSAENSRPVDSSRVGGIFKSAVNVEINNGDSITSLKFVWFKYDAVGTIINIDTLNYIGDVKHITPTVSLAEVKGANIFDDNFKNITQFYGTIAIPVGKRITVKGLYGFQATFKTAKQAVTLLPALLIQIN